MENGDIPCKQKGIGRDAAPSCIAPNQASPGKFYSQFLCKSLTLALFLVVLPLFPSEAPDFINQTIPTRGWELLQLLFVGIAVSYGLFSRRNDEPEKENYSKFDNAQSYVTRLLQVSSVFDDESEVSCGSDADKVQTWSSQYYREEPVVMVAKECSSLDDRVGVDSEIHEKPLILPVRSLKSRFSDSDVVGCIDNPGRISSSLSRTSSNPGSTRHSSNSVPTKAEESWDSNHLSLDENLENNIVLQSPIPWRLRSGRIELKEELDGFLLSSMEETELIRSDSRSLTSQMSDLSCANSVISLPKKFSKSPSLPLARNQSPELQSKSIEDMPRKGIPYKLSSPPPAPPPPPTPPITRKTASMNSNPGSSWNKKMSSEDFWQCNTNESKDLSMNGKKEHHWRANSWEEANPFIQAGRLSVGKSVRTVKSGPIDFERRARRIKKDDMNMEKGLKEEEPIPMDKTEQEMMGSNDVSFSLGKHSYGGLGDELNSTFSEFQEENGYADKYILGSNLLDFQEKEFNDDFIPTPNKELDSEDQHNDLGFGNNEARSSIASDGGPDVDKKADEFIAKFREQIRLQRIESFRRSSKQIGRKSLR